VLAELKSQGLVRHVGLSNVTPRQLQEGQRITEIRLRPKLLQSGTSR